MESIWKRDKLVEIIRKIEGTIMIEFKRNGNNTIASNRIPVFVGEFVYDEEKESFVRNGRGYWIDEETRIATREVEWKDGVEVSGRDLYDGWYTQSTKQKPNLYPNPNQNQNPNPNQKPKPKPKLDRGPAPMEVSITGSAKLSDVNLKVTALTISTNCCNDLNALDLSRFKWLRSIEIGNNCFGSVQTVKIYGLNRLKTIKIGNNSFNQVKVADWKNNFSDASRDANKQSKSFHILNCRSLESILIGQYSFSDFAGNFDLRNLPQLQSIQIGVIGSKSYNFYRSSFVIRGIEMLLNI